MLSESFSWPLLCPAHRRESSERRQLFLRQCRLSGLTHFRARGRERSRQSRGPLVWTTKAGPARLLLGRHKLHQPRFSGRNRDPGGGDQQCRRHLRQSTRPTPVPRRTASSTENGVYTSYEYPGFTGQTNGQGINNNGETVGFYQFNSPEGFFNNSGGFSSFGYPQTGATTFPHALNDSGEAVGYYRIYSDGEIGFVYSGGTFTTFTYPNSYETFGGGINNLGVVAGYANLNTGYSAGFLWQNGQFTAINSTASPLPNGINNNGQLVGTYTPSGFYHGFLATPTACPGFAICPHPALSRGRHA